MPCNTFSLNEYTVVIPWLNFFTPVELITLPCVLGPVEEGSERLGITNVGVQLSQSTLIIGCSESRWSGVDVSGVRAEPLRSFRKLLAVTNPERSLEHVLNEVPLWDGVALFSGLPDQKDTVEAHGVLLV